VSGSVVAVSASPTHSFSKAPAAEITLLAGLGVQGDAHCGVTVQHRSRVERDPSQPNLRQVHLIHAELFEELAGKGFVVGPGRLGENITTRGVDLLALPVGTELRIGRSAIVELTGLRNPCAQLEGLRAGLMSAVLDRTTDGEIVRKSGVMGIVVAGGPVRAGDSIVVVRPAGPYRPLERV
jgi:MOSC domain-containing protein YiiM